MCTISLASGPQARLNVSTTPQSTRSPPRVTSRTSGSRSSGSRASTMWRNRVGEQLIRVAPEPRTRSARARAPSLAGDMMSIDAPASSEIIILPRPAMLAGE